VASENVLIVGTGCAGYTAALYTSRAGLAPLVYEGDLPHGQLGTTTLVENYPGFPEGIDGPVLMMHMRQQAERFGTRYQFGMVTGIDVARRPFTVTIDDDKKVEARTVIIAAGASPRYLGLESERQLLGHGLSSCATCDGAFFRNEELVVVGGGDTAMEDSLFLTRFASKVTIIHRRDQLRASKVMQERARQNPKIHYIWDTVVTDIHDPAKKAVTGVHLRDLKTGEETDLACGGVFVAIGHEPNTKWLKGVVDLHDNGYIKVTHPSTRTSVEGVFACGDCVDHVYRQAVTAAGTGCAAAIDAERFLAEKG
jgi:thioredoxin reductase (NADPH)